METTTTTVERTQSEWKSATLRLFNRKTTDGLETCRGRWVAKAGETHCWELSGPALEAWTKLQSEISSCLSSKNFARTIIITCYMCGKSRAEARPTIILSGADEATRMIAKRCIKSDRLLKDYSCEKFLLKQMRRDPSLTNLVAVNDSVAAQPTSKTGMVIRRGPPSQYVVENHTIEPTATATLSGPVFVDGVAHFLTSAHVLTGHSPFDDQGQPDEKEDRLDDLETSDEDTDDDEGYGTASSMDIYMYRTYFPPSTNVKALTALPTPQHEPVAKDRPSNHRILQKNVVQHVDKPRVKLGALQQAVPDQRADVTVMSFQIGTRLEEIEVFIGSCELDYALLKVELSGLPLASTVVCPPDDSSSDSITRTEQLAWIRTRDRWLRGNLLVSDVMYKIGTSVPGRAKVFKPRHHFDMIHRGDSGSFAYSSGRICGHVMAGDLDTGKALLAPLDAVSADIEVRYGKFRLTRPLGGTHEPITASVQRSVLIRESQAPAEPGLPAVPSFHMTGKRSRTHSPLQLAPAIKWEFASSRSPVVKLEDDIVDWRSDRKYAKSATAQDDMPLDHSEITKPLSPLTSLGLQITEQIPASEKGAAKAEDAFTVPRPHFTSTTAFFRPDQIAPVVLTDSTPSKKRRRGMVLFDGQAISEDHEAYSLLPVDRDEKHFAKRQKLDAPAASSDSARLEYCPVPSCAYHTKGFTRKYNRDRHLLTHYKGTMVCGLCPGSGTVTERSFNRADVFKRHLFAVHGIRGTQTHAGKSLHSTSGVSLPGDQPQKPTSGTCSSCHNVFNTVAEFYAHLDDCVLSFVSDQTRKGFDTALSGNAMADVEAGTADPIHYDGFFPG